MALPLEFQQNKKNIAYCLLGLIVIIFSVLTAFYMLGAQHSENDSSVSNLQTHNAYFETNPTFDELIDYMQALGREEGAVHAFDVAIYGDLPAEIDSHLLGHYIGDVLYEQQGLEGLTHCTQDLGFACAHQIVINRLIEFGDSVFEEINEICAQTTGPNSYGMCFHGFGHAVLAYTEYELPKAIELCQRVGTDSFGRHEIDECVGGVIMEMRGGLHDPDVWEQNGRKYLSSETPFTMCEADYMPEANKNMCYQYITPFIYDHFGPWTLPTIEHSYNAINHCSLVLDIENQTICYGGFAKEFMSYMYGRDIKKIFTATDDDLRFMFDQCMLAEEDIGKEACVSYTIRQLDRGGMYEPVLGARFCMQVDEVYTSACMQQHLRAVLRNKPNQEDLARFCKFTAENYRPLCRQTTTAG